MPLDAIAAEMNIIAEMQRRMLCSADDSLAAWLQNHIHVHTDKLNRMLDLQVSDMLFGTGVYATCHPIEISFY